MNEIMIRNLIERATRNSRNRQTLIDTNDNQVTMANITRNGMIYGVIGTSEEMAQMTAFIENEAPEIAHNIETQIKNESRRQFEEAMREMLPNTVDGVEMDDDYIDFYNDLL